MDSLTQIVLGAAAGEVVAGRKLGNRAMIWGAVAGTIPDLDVFANFFMNDIEALAVHRGISHSFLFSFAAPFLFALFARWYYSSDIFRKKAVRVGAQIFFGLFLLFIAFALGFILGLISPWLLAIYVPAAGYLCFRMYLQPVMRSADKIEIPGFWRWYLLFFLAFFTHILLDASTPYGTQLLQPFSDYRFEWNGISVADPLYTVPFLICLIAASFFRRNSRTRRIWCWAGIAISSAYLTFGYFQHSRATGLFEARLAETGYEIHRYMVNPTILNTILWHGVAEVDDRIIEGYYSFLEEGKPFDQLKVFDRKEELLEGCHGSREVEIVKWFAKDYWTVDTIASDPGKVVMNDLRFGSIWPMRGGENYHFIFQFVVDTESCRVSESERGGGRDRENFLADMWQRIKGNRAVPDSR